MSQRISIDKNNQVILLYSNDRNDWEDKTDSISGIYKAYYYGNTSGYEVFFKGVNTLFFYKKNNVQILDKVKDVDISEFDVLINNKLEEATKVEEFQNKYYRIKTATEKFLSNKVIFESNKYKDIYEYYRKLAEYAGTVAETNTPLSFLSINYSRISSTLNDSVLKDFLRGKCKSVLCRKGTILPFDFNQSQLKAIEEASKKIAIFKASNMSLGVNMLTSIAKETAGFLGSDYDIEIIEQHHNQKIDSPSGTALTLANAINEVRHNTCEYVYGRHNPSLRRKPNEIGIHAIRGGSIVGKHDIMYIGRRSQ